VRRARSMHSASPETPPKSYFATLSSATHMPAATASCVAHVLSMGRSPTRKAGVATAPPSRQGLIHAGAKTADGRRRARPDPRLEQPSSASPTSRSGSPSDSQPPGSPRILTTRVTEPHSCSHVATAGNRGWSLYGAPWLQPVAISGKRVGAENGRNKRKPLPSVATRRTTRE
jgi:hypothetical protein